MPDTATGHQQAAADAGRTDASHGDAARQEALRRRGEIPEHVAIIMDGNGRWASRRGLPRAAGHREGVVSVREITEACAQLGVGHLTLYTFSTENWLRPAMEVNALMTLLIRTVRKERRTLLDNNVRLRTIGDTAQLPAACRQAPRRTCEETAAGARMTLTLALSYSGRWDILRAVRRLARRAQSGELAPKDIDEVLFAEALATAGMPDPDLLVRTGGEQRLSNFLLWEMAYTEMHITERYWPDFRRAALYEAVRSFQDRDRRFGRVST